jgi:hypothetical protein
MLVSQRLYRKGSRVDLRSAFEVLEPYAGKLARTVLRGLEARKGPRPTRLRSASTRAAAPLGRLAEATRSDVGASPCWQGSGDR